MTETLTEDVARFRAANGLNANEARRAVWMAQLGNFILPLPNFKWRRAVIDRHDAHHVLTGYPATASGELSLAAWELGAKCYEDWRARVLCWGLMCVGLTSQPKRTLTAYAKGKSQAKYYAALRKQGFFECSV